MATLNQNISWVNNIYPFNSPSPSLAGSPQSSGVVFSVNICTPRKPNSARRPIVNANLSCNNWVLAHIPGSGHNLSRHSNVLVCGTGARDLPVVNYSCLRGVFDFSPLFSNSSRSSIYGVKRPLDLKTHVRRNQRNKLD